MGVGVGTGVGVRVGVGVGVDVGEGRVRVRVRVKVRACVRLCVSMCLRARTIRGTQAILKDGSLLRNQPQDRHGHTFLHLLVHRLCVKQGHDLRCGRTPGVTILRRVRCVAVA